MSNKASPIESILLEEFTDKELFEEHIKGFQNRKKTKSN